MSILTKIKEIFFPTTIKEVPFPSSTQTAGTPVGGETKEVYTPTEVTPMSFPTLNIATGLKSTTFDTETRIINSNYSFQPLGAISIGTVRGTGLALTGSGIRISPLGIYGYKAGVISFTLSSAGDFVTSGFIQVGGAAADVNAGVTTIGAGKILISGSTLLSAWSSGSDATYIDGGKLYTNSVTANKISVTNLAAINADMGTITAGSIDAARIKTGTLTIGGTDQPTQLTIQESSLTGNARLGWQHGSRLWEDSSSDMGLNAIGGDFWVYTNSTWRLLVTDSGGINVNGYVNCKSLNLNQDQDEGNINKIDYLNGFNDLRLKVNGGSEDFEFKDKDDHSHAIIHGQTGRFQSDNSYVTLNGVDKTAIVSTSQDYRALYCAEAPEVWFFDFCKSKDKISPLFLEVTEGEMNFIKCEKGYQVWRRRKGHTNKRFEPKTALQFYKNEAFYKLAK